MSIACIVGNLNIVKYLHSIGASNYWIHCEYIPIEYCVQYNNYEIIDFFLDNLPPPEGGNTNMTLLDILCSLIKKSWNENNHIALEYFKKKIICS